MDMTVPHALRETTTRSPAFLPNPEQVEVFHASQVRATYQRPQKALWIRWNPAPRPSFNPALLNELRSCCNWIATTGPQPVVQGETLPIEYVIVRSDTPGVFNLGGDLDLFSQLIEARDSETLRRYGMACIDVLHQNYKGYGLPILTVSLVEGECLGGGFEAALSSDVLIAERSARFGFPEILFNLFPGMGAYSFLERRVGQRAAENLITSGKIYSADDMLRLGIVDFVVDDGAGEAEVKEFIRRNQRSRNGMTGVARVRRRINGIDHSELMDIVDIWVDTAMRLNVRDLKLMQRLVSRQNDLAGSGGAMH